MLPNITDMRGSKTMSFILIIVVATFLPPAIYAEASSSASYVQVKGMKTSYLPGEKPRILVNAIDGKSLLVSSDGWNVGARIRRPNDPTMGIDVNVNARMSSWTLSPIIPAEYGEYFLRVMFTCNASFLPCGANGTMVSLTQDIPFSVSSGKARRTDKPLKFPITKQTTTAAQVTKDDGLTDAELLTLLLKKDTGVPRINSVDVEGNDCSLSRVWVDIRTANGTLPHSSSPTNVQMYEYTYFSTAKKYGTPSQWEYWPRGNGYVPTIAYGIVPGQTSVHLLEAREKAKSAWKLLTVTCKNGKLDAKLSEPQMPPSLQKLSAKPSVQSPVSSAQTSLVAVSGWTTYNHDEGKFSIALPEDWKGISGYDGSLYDITTIAKFGIESYGNPDHTYEMMIDSKNKSNVNTQGKSLLEFANENMVFLSPSTLHKVTNGTKWTRYDYSAPPSSPGVQYQVLFDMGDTIVVFSFPKHDPLADAILTSFMPK